MCESRANHVRVVEIGSDRYIHVDDLARELGLTTLAEAKQKVRALSGKASVALKREAVYNVLTAHSDTGITKSAWATAAVKTTGIPKTTADRMIDYLIARERVADQKGRPACSTPHYWGKLLFPAPLDTPNQGV